MELKINNCTLVLKSLIQELTMTRPDGKSAKLIGRIAEDYVNILKKYNPVSDQSTALIFDPTNLQNIETAVATINEQRNKIQDILLDIGDMLGGDYSLVAISKLNRLSKIELDKAITNLRSSGVSVSADKFEPKDTNPMTYYLEAFAQTDTINSYLSTSQKRTFSMD